MILCVFAVRDAAVGAFLPPFFARSKGEALRQFTVAVNDAEHQFHKHASDYTLFILGEYDDNSAVFSTYSPERVIGALECMDSANPSKT